MSTKGLVLKLLKNAGYETVEDCPEKLQYDVWKYLPSKYLGKYQWEVNKTTFKVCMAQKCSITQLQASNSPHGIEIAEAEKNYTTIVGEAPSAWQLFKPMFYKSWSKIKRGKDLFIPGMGGFDIAQAAEAFRELQGYYKKHVACFQAVGYIGDSSGYYGWRVLNNKKMREWVAKNWNWVKENKGKVDEIYYGLSKRIEFSQSLDVPVSVVISKGGGINIEKIKFDWLAEVELPEPFKIPKSGAELHSAGLKFKNCAAQYTGRVAKKRAVIVYTDNAMAEIDKTQIKQILGKGNSQVSRSVRNLFNENLPMILEKVWG
jgi:hypothetical protein